MSGQDQMADEDSLFHERAVLRKHRFRLLPDHLFDRPERVFRIVRGGGILLPEQGIRIFEIGKINIHRLFQKREGGYRFVAAAVPDDRKRKSFPPGFFQGVYNVRKKMVRRHKIDAGGTLPLKRKEYFFQTVGRNDRSLFPVRKPIILTVNAAELAAAEKDGAGALRTRKKRLLPAVERCEADTKIRALSAEAGAAAQTVDAALSRAEGAGTVGFKDCHIRQSIHGICHRRYFTIEKEKGQKQTAKKRNLSMIYNKINRKTARNADGSAGECFPIREIPAGSGALPVLVSPLMEQVPGIRHFFTTREGGVSEGILRSLNLSFSRGDEKSNVDENFRRVAAAFDTTPAHIVSTDQTHTANIRVVTAEDAGKGVVRPRDYTDVDGLITMEEGLILGVYVADCVPVLIADPVTGAIGAVHSGWRGTVAGIGAAAVRMMKELYGTKPENLICAVGPSICRDCYEVSEDVAQRFEETLAERAGEAVFFKGISSEGERKYLVDLWQANRIVLEKEGVLPRHISVTDVCTACNADLLFSHRASAGKRGNLGAFIMREHK